MTVKRKDFQKLASTVHQFLLKLTDTYECAELRDSLNMSLVQLQKYYRKCQQRLQHCGRHNNNDNNTNNGYVSPRQSLRFKVTNDRPLSPMTPYIEEPYYFHVKWTVLDQSNVTNKLLKTLENESSQTLEPIRSLYTPPVHYAAMKQDFELLEVLFGEKRDVLEDQDCLGRTPLMYATYHEKYDVAKWLLVHGADVNSCDYDEMTSLHWACYQSNITMIELLLEAGASINSQDSFGRCCCHWASSLEFIEVLKLLLEYNPNINLHDKNGLTPAMWACRLDRIDNLRLLLNVENQVIDHIDGFERDRNGRTIIHWSIRRQAPLECLKYLLNNAEMGQLRDDEGKTVLLLSAEQGALESCKLIVQQLNSSVIHDVDDKDRSCLHLATSAGHGEIVNFLLDSGANLYSKDRTGATCLDIAINQYLYYCHLIISSHIRSMERRKESTDCVELIEKASSRHNSVSEQRNYSLPRSPPRQSRSPGKSRRPLVRSTSNFDDEYHSGFDVMSCDPIREKVNSNNSVNKKKASLTSEIPNGPPIESGFDIIHYENIGGPIDYLNTDTGQEYHEKENERPEKDKPTQSRLSRPLKRAQNDNKLAKNKVNNTSRDSNSAFEQVSSRSHNPPVYQANELSFDGTLENVKVNSPPINNQNTGPRINYAATLEPLRIPTEINSMTNEDHKPMPQQRRRRKRQKPSNINSISDFGVPLQSHNLDNNKTFEDVPNHLTIKSIENNSIRNNIPVGLSTQFKTDSPSSTTNNNSNALLHSVFGYPAERNVSSRLIQSMPNSDRTSNEFQENFSNNSKFSQNKSRNNLPSLL